MALKKVEDANEPKVVERTEEIKVTDISTPSISFDDVKKLLAEQEAKFEARIKKLQSKKEDTLEDLNDEDYIDSLQDDWLEEPATFFVFASSYGLYGDKVRGKFTKPPHGAIKFKNVYRTRQRNSNGEKIISVSSAIITSKAQADYIRSCSAFGFEIFEDMNSVKSIDAAWAQKLVESSNVVSNFSDAAVVARCKQEGLPISQDIIGLRRELTTLIAKKNEEQHKFLLENKLRKATVDPDTKRITEEK